MMKRKTKSPNNFIDVVFFINLLHGSNKIPTLQLSKGNATSTWSVYVVKYSVDDGLSWIDGIEHSDEWNKHRKKNII